MPSSHPRSRRGDEADSLELAEVIVETVGGTPDEGAQLRGRRGAGAGEEVHKLLAHRAGQSTELVAIRDRPSGGGHGGNDTPASLKSKVYFQRSRVPEADGAAGSRRAAPGLGLHGNVLLENERPRADEVGEPLALRGIEQLEELEPP